MRGLWLWFLARSFPLQIALLLVVLALAAFLSPILSALAVLALIVILIVLLVRLVRGMGLPRLHGLFAFKPRHLLSV